MKNRFDLTGKVALVTGGSSGLGRHFALTLAAAGAAVAVAARRDDKVAEVASEIAAAGGQVVRVALDVTNRESIADAFETVEREAGTVTVLVNNAGIAQRDMALDVSEDHWDQVIGTNLTGVWAVAQEAARRMVKGEVGGSIVSIASLLSKRVSPGIMPYAVSKAGVAHMTRALAVEWAQYGIRVNAIAPGYFETELNREYLRSDYAQTMIKRIPFRRTGELEELSGPLLMLCSDAGSYVSGTVISVDGAHAVNSF